MGSKRKPENPLDPGPCLKTARVQTRDQQPNSDAAFYRAPLTKNNLRQLDKVTPSKETNTVPS